MASHLPVPLLDWRNEWTLDVGFMDEDHRHLAALLNRLARDHGVRAEAPGQPIADPGAASLHDALNALAREVRQHFHREEEVMRTDAYPDFGAHKADHDLLLAELSVLMRELRESGSACLTQAALEGLKDWLMGHVLDFDRPLAEFLKHPARQPPAPPGSD